MNLAEIKEWMVMTEGKGGVARRGPPEWLIAEVERQAGLNTLWEAQNLENATESHRLRQSNREAFEMVTTLSAELRAERKRCTDIVLAMVLNGMVADSVVAKIRAGSLAELVEVVRP